MADLELLDSTNGPMDVSGSASGSIRLNNNCITKDNKLTMIQDPRHIELKSAEIQTCSIETQTLAQTMVNGVMENGIPGLGELSEEDSIESSENKVSKSWPRVDQELTKRVDQESWPRVDKNWPRVDQELTKSWHWLLW